MSMSIDDDSPSGRPDGEKKIRWLPGEKQRLNRLKAKIQAGDYEDDTYAGLNPHRLLWVIWLRARGYFSDDLPDNIPESVSE